MKLTKIITSRHYLLDMGHNECFLKQAVEHIDITSFDARPIRLCQNVICI